MSRGGVSDGVTARRIPAILGVYESDAVSVSHIAAGFAGRDVGLMQTLCMQDCQRRRICSPHKRERFSASHSNK